ncbi:MAG: short-chain dehydrogenase [Deltaproteobacteria bacterium]|nr:short-chain dehydrogenase [Deltaproteobacteria bacterium]
MILENKNILVSGVGPGLGREIASRVLRDGGNVVIGARKAESLEAAAQELDPSGERVLAHSFDITDEESCARIITATEERFGRLDGIAQVAAAEPMGDLDSTPMQDFRTTTEVNVIGSVQLVKAAVPAFERAGGGSVVLIGSQSTELPPPSPQLAYSASKGALRAVSIALSTELGPKKIRVNTVVPTWMWGPPVQGYITWQANERGVTEDVVKGEIESLFSLGEIPADDDVAEAVVVFLSDRMRMVTGEFLRVDAGQLKRL